MKHTLPGITSNNMHGQGEKRLERDARIDADDQSERKRPRTELDHLIAERAFKQQMKEMEL